MSGYFNQQNSQASYPQQGNYSPYGGYMPQMKLTTNVETVVSLDEAIMRTNVRNSDMLYLDQNKPVMYRVRVDIYGTKTWAEFPYVLPDNSKELPASKADIDLIWNEINALKNKTTEDVTNGNTNG